MDLTTLVTACALMVDPKIMHALIWHHSGGEPWAFTLPGVQQPQVLRSVGDAVDAARTTQPDDVAIRVGLAGLPATPRSVSAAMFAPCSNVASAARQIVQLAELCRASARVTGDPVYCAIAAWHGAWERPDNSFADAVRISVANNDTPDFEMPAGAGSETADIGSLRQPASREAATAPPTLPAMANAPASVLSFRSCPGRPTVRRSTVRQATGLQPTSKSPTFRPSVSRRLSRTPMACLCRGQRSDPCPARNDGVSQSIACIRIFGGRTWQRQDGDGKAAR